MSCPSVCHVEQYRHLKDEVYDNIILWILNWTFKLSLVRDVYSLKHCIKIKIYPHLILFESQNFKISRQIKNMFRPFSPDHSMNNIEKLASSKFWFCVRRTISNALIYRVREIWTFERGNWKSLICVSKFLNSEVGNGHVWTHKLCKVSGCR
jgi:hypothetical protein